MCAIFWRLLVSFANNTAIIKLTFKILYTLKHFYKVFSLFLCHLVDLQNWSDIFHSGFCYFPLPFCQGKRLFPSPEWKQNIRNLAVGIYLYPQESIVLNLHISLTIRCKKLISQPHYAPTFVPSQFLWSKCLLQLWHPASPQGSRDTLQSRASKKGDAMASNCLAVDFNSWSIFKVVSEMEQAVTTLWCLSRVISH